MGLLNDQVRLKRAESLNASKANITKLVTALLGEKTNLENVKTDTSGDQVIYSADDVADVQSILDHYATEIAKL